MRRGPEKDKETYENRRPADTVCHGRPTSERRENARYSTDHDIPIGSWLQVQSVQEKIGNASKQDHQRSNYVEEEVRYSEAQNYRDNSKNKCVIRGNSIGRHRSVVRPAHQFVCVPLKIVIEGSRTA